MSHYVQIAIYVLCLITSAGCTWLLLKGYRRTLTRLLLWTALCFAFLSLNSLVVLFDLVVFPQWDLRRNSAWRGEGPREGARFDGTVGPFFIAPFDTLVTFGRSSSSLRRPRAYAPNKRCGMKRSQWLADVLAISARGRRLAGRPTALEDGDSRDPHRHALRFELVLSGDRISTPVEQRPIHGRIARALQWKPRTCASPDVTAGILIPSPLRTLFAVPIVSRIHLAFD